MALDIAALRAETPGCAHVAHLNNSGSSLPTRRTLDATLDYLRLEAEIGGYEAADLRHGEIEGFYASAARLLNCGTDEIAYVENATRAWDLAFYSYAERLGPGDRVVTCRSEYPSNYIAFLQVAKKRGVEIVPLANDESGQVSLADLERRLDQRTKLVAISHMPTNGGLLQPAAAIGRLARAAGVPYLLDACQTVGQMPVDVEALGCDFLCATGRKFLRGPRGTGFLYVRQRSFADLEPVMLDLYAARWAAADRYEVIAGARRFENWERYFGGILGQKAAIDQALELGLDAVWGRIKALSDGLRARLARMPGVVLRDLGAERGGIVTFTIPGGRHGALRDALRARGINVSVSGGSQSPLDLLARGLPDVMRAAPHIYNTEDELDRLCAEIARFAR